MKLSLAVILLASCTFLGTAAAQTTGARSTPQTQGATPSGISPDATGAAEAARNSAARGTRRRGQTGNAAQQGSSGGTNTATSSGQTTAPQGQAGITGVPEYDPGSGRQTNTPAPVATGRVTVTGDANGDGMRDRNANSLEAGAPLPGVTLRHNSLGIPPGTPIQVRLRQPVDSGHVKNGQNVDGTLTAPLGKVPSGAPVQLTVVAVAKAGEISSRGELSLQVVSVNGEPALSEIITAEGKEGAKILPDAAPARGTEAIFTADQTITLPAS